MVEGIKHKVEVIKIRFLLDKLESKALGILGLNQCEDIQEHTQSMYKTLFYEFYQQYKNQQNLEFLVSYLERLDNNKKRFNIKNLTEFNKRKSFDNIISCFISGVYYKNSSQNVSEVLEKIQKQEIDFMFQDNKTQEKKSNKKLIQKKWPKIENDSKERLNNTTKMAQQQNVIRNPKKNVNQNIMSFFKPNK